mgnify:CR=1 FL=1
MSDREYINSFSDFLFWDVEKESIDLDFFGKIDAPLEDIVLELSSFASVSPISASKMMRFLIVDGIKVDIVNYPYPWILLLLVKLHG